MHGDSPVSQSTSLAPPKPARRRAVSVKRGKRNETRCARELEAEGYITWQTIRLRFRNMDLFRRFDVLAVSGDGTKLRFIQVKTNYCPLQDRVSIRDFPMLLGPGVTKEIWTWKAKKGEFKKEVLP